MIKVGDRVVQRTSESFLGVVQTELRNGVYEVIWDNGDLEIVHESEIQIKEVSLSPWDFLTSNDFNDFRNFTISTIVNKIRNNNNNTISTLKASKTIFKPYQFIPLLKLLNSTNNRIIIADEVGLGKTISAGHIIMELLARKQLNSLLIICLNSLQDKWIDELQNKFNINVRKFVNLTDFKSSILNLEENGESFFGVINYDKFTRRSNVEFFESHAIKLDLVIFDEAHRLRNETNTRKSLKPIAKFAESVVMLTATPIMTSLENLFNLISLLDEEEFSNYQVFRNAISINKPFIRAYSQLNHGVKASEIARELNEATIENVFKYVEEYRTTQKLAEALEGDELFKLVIKELTNAENLNPAKKVEIQRMLINLNSLNHIYSRTRKKDVSTSENTVIRNSRVIEINMNDIEEEIYFKYFETEFDDGIGTVQKKRKFSSSFFAHSYTKEVLLNDQEIIQDEDGKFSALCDIINEEDKPIIVFSFFKNTLLYLRKRLIHCGYQSEIIYGDIDIFERNNVLKRFEEGGFQVLLSSEVGSTGLDMQFCDRIVNYDLPWNPMVVEQRIGRIDRIGQQSEIINIFSLVYKDTIEEKICNRLYNRIKLFQESLGDLDEILGQKSNYIEGQIQDIYMRNLTTEQREARLNQIASAIEMNKLQLKQIEEGLKDSFSNDLYFQNEVLKIEKNKKYLTETDLIEVINRLIANELTTITFSQSAEKKEVYLFAQDKKDILFDFIEKYMDGSNIEMKKMFRSFKTKNFGNKIPCTFNQEYAFTNKNIEYISAYHPIVDAASNYFSIMELDRNNIFRFAINRSVFHINIQELIRSDFYFLIKYEIEVQKVIAKKVSNFNYLKAMVIDLESDDFHILPEELGEEFASYCQQHIMPMPNEGMIVFNQELTTELKLRYSEFVLNQKEEFENKEKIIFSSEVDRRIKQEKLDLMKRLESLQLRLENEKGIKNIVEHDINSLQKRIKELDDAKAESRINFKNRLISLNLIFVNG